MSWLENLKVGDEVIISGGINTISTVGRLTKTQIIINKSRYRKSDGKIIGGAGYNAAWLLEASPGKRHEIECSRLRLTVISKLNSTNWHN